MAATESATRRLAAIDSATRWSRLADGVVVAAVHWQQSGTLEDDDVRAIDACNEWLKDVESLLTDPLDLPTTASNLSNLSALTPFATFGSERDSGFLESGINQGDPVEDREAMLQSIRSLRTRLESLATGGVTEEEVVALRRGFERIATGMLQSTGDLLVQGGRRDWATISNS